MVFSSSLDVIEAIERHSARAWPAPIVIPVQGWEMRFAPDSSSLRVNSLNPVAPDPGAFRSVLRAYIAECRARKSKAHVRLLPLARENEADDLTSLGLRSDGGTSVQLMELEHLQSDCSDVMISQELNEAWLDAYIGAHRYAPEERLAIRNILQAVPHPMGFAHIVADDLPVAAGRTAIIDGLAGFYQIVTTPAARRKGYARRIMSALMSYAAEQGAKTGYLQVEIRNTPARALYASLGFKPLYNYDYWSVPTSINLNGPSYIR